MDPYNFKRNFLGKHYNNVPHPHYSVREINTYFEGKFTIERVHIGGLVIYPSTVFINAVLNRIFGLIDRGFLPRIGHLEHLISFGRLGYNLIVKARKI